MRVATYEEASKLPPIRSLLNVEDLAKPVNIGLWLPNFLRRGESVLDAVKRLEEFGKGAEFVDKIANTSPFFTPNTLLATLKQQMDAGQPIKFVSPTKAEVDALFEHSIQNDGSTSRVLRRAELLFGFTPCAATTGCTATDRQSRRRELLGALKIE